MAQTYALDKRCTDILKMVVYAGGYVSVSDITDQLGISKRSAYYDIEKINDWLRDNGLPELDQALLFQDKVHSHRTFSPIERERLAICLICLYEKPVYVETLMEFSDVSRNTTVSDLKDVASFLKKNKLRLHYLIKKGYRIQGDPVKKRALFFLYFPQFIDYLGRHHSGNTAGPQRDRARTALRICEWHAAHTGCFPRLDPHGWSLQ